jgi:hypothetical protein
MFALPEHIESYMAEVLHRLASERHLRELPRDQFAERLTDARPDRESSRSTRPLSGRPAAARPRPRSPAGAKSGPDPHRSRSVHRCILTGLGVGWLDRELGDRQA